MKPESVAVAPNCEQADETGLLPLTSARSRIRAALEPIGGVVQVPLRTALGRVLAQDVRSPLDVPAHTNSAVDGYALAGADLPVDGPRRLPVRGQCFAGHRYQDPVEPGTCIQITTGAVMPAGTDTVVMLEHVQRDDHGVRIDIGHRPGQNVRQAGEDLARGQIALTAGTRLTSAQVGLLASVGCAEVAVRRRLRVALFSTGDELRQVGQALDQGQIYDSNRYTLHAMLERLGVEMLDYGVVRDDPASLRATLQRAAQDADAVVTSGGVSVGEADHIKQTLAQLGDIGFWKIAMKPGRPFAFGNIGDALLFGLPGNPVAVMVTFYQLVQPALHWLAGGSGDGLPQTFEVECAEPLRKKPGRTEFIRGVLERGDDGRLRVRSTGQQGSGILSSMCKADCFVILPHDGGTVQPGDRVQVQPFQGLV